MKFGSAEDFYIAHAEYVQKLEDRAGIPRPCPRCGEPVTLARVKNGWVVDCVDCWGGYPKAHTTAEDAWREHERLCREAEEAEE